MIINNPVVMTITNTEEALKISIYSSVKMARHTRYVLEVNLLNLRYVRLKIQHTRKDVMTLLAWGIMHSSANRFRR
jgi:hypothetical protein